MSEIRFSRRAFKRNKEICKIQGTPFSPDMQVSYSELEKIASAFRTVCHIRQIDGRDIVPIEFAVIRNASGTFLYRMRYERPDSKEAHSKFYSQARMEKLIAQYKNKV